MGKEGESTIIEKLGCTLGVDAGGENEGDSMTIGGPGLRPAETDCGLCRSPTTAATAGNLGDDRPAFEMGVIEREGEVDGSRV